MKSEEKERSDEEIADLKSRLEEMIENKNQMMNNITRKMKRQMKEQIRAKDVIIQQNVCFANKYVYSLLFTSLYLC